MPGEQEVPLEGGNTSAGVVRVGATVRKPWTASTPTSLELMGVVRSAGVVPSGREPWAPMDVEGHGEHWRRVAGSVERHEETWARTLG